MSDEVGYRIAPGTKYYTETPTVVGVGHGTIEKLDQGFVDSFGKKWEYEGKLVKDKSETMKHAFLDDFINPSTPSDAEGEKIGEVKKNTSWKEKIEVHEEKIDDENIKIHKEGTFVQIEKYDKAPVEETFIQIEKDDKTPIVYKPEQRRKRGIIKRIIKEKIPQVHNKVEEKKEVVFEKIKEKIPHVHKKVEEEKKVIIEKIKEKIPIYHLKIEEKK